MASISGHHGVKPKPAVISTAVAALAIGLGLAAQPGRALARHGHAGPPKGQSAHRASAPAASAYAALGRVPTGADLANASIVGAARSDTALLPSEARALAQDASGTVWLVPTNDGRLCLAVQPGGQYAAIEASRHVGHLTLADTCATEAAVAARGIALRLYNDVIGLVPDGVRMVTVALGFATPSAAAVDRNVYRVGGSSAAPGPRSASFVTLAGMEEVTPLP